jgi:hypothetical protein
MIESSAGLFTIGVFQDAAWAEKGLQALRAQGFPLEALTVIVKDTPDAGAFLDRTFGTKVGTMEIKAIGTVRAHGPLISALQGGVEELTKRGIAATARRVGFQTHDGRIFETLTARGGVLVAVAGEARAADALAVLHSYGGGNAAIGAWGGRV